MLAGQLVIFLEDGVSGLRMERRNHEVRTLKEEALILSLTGQERTSVIEVFYTFSRYLHS